MQHAARVMDVDIVVVPVDEAGRMTGEALRATLDEHGIDDLFAIVATGGTTNYGVVDDIRGCVDVGRERGSGCTSMAPTAWRLCARPAHVRSSTASRTSTRSSSIRTSGCSLRSTRARCCIASLRSPRPRTRRPPDTSRSINEDTEYNPSDYAVHLSRRARGLPFWFSLATHGTQAYSDAVERTLEVARAAADGVRKRQYLELVREPNLSVVVFRRIGWARADYYAWSERLLAANFAFVLPTTHYGETVTRFAVVNPRTTEADLSLILDTMAGLG